MSVTYDLQTNVGKVRLQIPDTNLQKAVFSDEEINILLEANNGNPLLAAAAALEIIAGDPQRVQQYSRGGISATKTPTDVLLKRAQELRRRSRGAWFEVH